MTEHEQYRFSALDDLSRPTTPSVSTSEPEHPEHPKHPQQLEQQKQPQKPEELDSKSEQNDKKPFDWAGSWIWEVGAAVSGTVSIALLIGFLAYVNDTSYANWQYSVSPNAVISIIVAAAKAAMLGLLTSCISQLKWNQYG
ncbi:hypothetical protein SI65_00979 [Aspergillus cristatus]|uniref:Uncharacterized protein n=1 Tax=Aspergillus cristatus TaxID=573508 RepID=A0A1E3BR02_ASPCR|nr:hypothetical protein SI65_00979 [Aspergillus cristatus]